MIRAAVCDDEKESRDYVSGLIRRQPFPCEIVEYASAKECLLDEKKIDLLFLDIELQPAGSGMDGMALAQKLRQRKKEFQPVIIFVTGYDRYVFDAFDVDAFQYLIKPVEEERFARIFARAAGKIRAERGSRREAGNLALRSAGTVRNLLLDDIYYIESCDHRVVVHLKNGDFTCYARIRDLEEELQDRFFRIHKGYLLNLACVERYDKTEAVLVNGEKLSISKYKYREFVKAYLCFLKKEQTYE